MAHSMDESVRIIFQDTSAVNCLDGLEMYKTQ